MLENNKMSESTPPISPTYIPEEHFKNFLDNQLIKLNREEMKQARDMFDILYSYFNSYYTKYGDQDRNQFFSHATVYNWLVKYFDWPTPLVYVSQNIKNRDRDFQDFIDGFMNTFSQYNMTT